jgi:hypothetical protein
MAASAAALDVLIAANSTASSLHCLQILNKYLENALKTDEKYKKIKKSNDIFQVDILFV